MYDHPPPEGTEEAIGAVKLADPDSVFAGAGELLHEATKVRDALRRWTDRVIP